MEEDFNSRDAIMAAHAAPNVTAADMSTGRLAQYLLRGPELPEDGCCHLEKYKTKQDESAPPNAPAPRAQNANCLS